MTVRVSVVSIVIIMHSASSSCERITIPVDQICKVVNSMEVTSKKGVKSRWKVKVEEGRLRR